MIFTLVAGAARAEATRVGLVLPLSAQTVALKTEARGLYDAALLATFDAADVELVLVPKDSGTDDATAQRARAQLQGQVDMIVGPLFSTQTTEFIDLAVPILSLSNNRRLAAPGVYPLGVAPEDEVARLMQHACALGWRRVMMFAPKGDLFDRLEPSAVAGADACPGAALMAVTFSDTENGIKNSAETLAKMQSAFDAVLLPVGGAQGRAVIQSLRAAGMSPEDLPMMALSSVRDGHPHPALRGVVIAGPNPQDRQAFERRFLRAFGRPPTRLSGLSYDAVMVAAHLSRRQDPEALFTPGGFAGADGRFRINRDGRVTRRLAVLANGPQGWTLQAGTTTPPPVADPNPAPAPVPTPEVSMAPIPDAAETPMPPRAPQPAHDSQPGLSRQPQQNMIQQPPAPARQAQTPPEPAVAEPAATPEGEEISIDETFFR